MSPLDKSHMTSYPHSTVPLALPFQRYSLTWPIWTIIYSSLSITHSWRIKRGCWWTIVLLIQPLTMPSIAFSPPPNLEIQSTPMHSQSYFAYGRQCCY